MTIELWFAFVFASSALLVIPGPTILTVISYSMSHGNKAKVPLILSVALGDSTALGLSLIGLGTLLAESAFWFQIVKWVGGIYLLYLGFQLLKAGVQQNTEKENNTDKSTGWKLFLNTYMVTALNPKGIIFFVAFLPQFINKTHNVTSQLWVLAITFVALATINATIYAVFATKAQHILSSPNNRRKFNFTGGTMLSAAGLWALSSTKST